MIRARGKNKVEKNKERMWLENEEGFIFGGWLKKVLSNIRTIYIATFYIRTFYIMTFYLMTIH